MLVAQSDRAPNFGFIWGLIVRIFPSMDLSINKGTSISHQSLKSVVPIHNEVAGKAIALSPLRTLQGS